MSTRPSGVLRPTGARAPAWLLVLVSLVVLVTGTVAAGAADDGAARTSDDSVVAPPVRPPPTGSMAEPAAPLDLPAGRAFVRTARAFMAPGLVTVALVIGFGLAGRLAPARPHAKPKLDDDLRSFS